MANRTVLQQQDPLIEKTNDPILHAANIEQMLDDVTTHIRQDIERVDNPRAQALFETSAEVLQGLSKAYHDFQTKSERAWK